MNNHLKAPKSGDARQRSKELLEDLRSLSLLSKSARSEANRVIEESSRLREESDKIDKLFIEFLKAS